MLLLEFGRQDRMQVSVGRSDGEEADLLRPGPRPRACVRYESADSTPQRPASLMRQADLAWTNNEGQTAAGRAATTVGSDAR